MKNLSQSKTKKSGTSRVLDRYLFLPWTIRFFLWIRWHWTPYGEMAALFPREGKILDGGCGHGLLSLALALPESAREVFGIDHSDRRVSIASVAASGLSNISFQTGDYTDFSGGPYDGIALVDVLHYLPPVIQEVTLRKCFDQLGAGGLLLFREVDPSPGLASRFNKFHERIMTRLGFTQAQGLYFRHPEDWKAAAQRAGFQTSFRPLSRFPFADILFECRKP